MEETLICNDKFKYRNHLIGLPVCIDNLPNEIIFQGAPFLLKPDLHISLVCIEEIIRKHNILTSDIEEKILSDFCEFSKEHEIKLLSYTDNFRYAVRDERKSIIVMCNVSYLDKFFNLINKKYSLELECPPTHVTLYTPTSRLGIYLTDSNDINNLTVPIDNPIGLNL